MTDNSYETRTTKVDSVYGKVHDMGKEPMKKKKEGKMDNHKHIQSLKVSFKRRNPFEKD